jgi:hypothetical protein
LPVCSACKKRQFGEGKKLVSARIAGGDSGVQLGQCSLWIRLEALRQIPTIENDSAGIAFLADSQHIGGEFAMNNARIDSLDSDGCRAGDKQQ